MKIDNKEKSSFLEGLLSGDRPFCQSVVNRLLRLDYPILQIYEELFKDCLYKVGFLWEKNHISVAKEHMATLIVQDLMNDYFEKIISDKRINKKSIVAPVENEDHQVGAKMISDVFEMNGWDSIFAGPCTASQLVELISKNNPDVVCLSLSVYFNLHYLCSEINLIRKSTQLPIVIGGQALSKVGKKLTQQFSNLFYCSNLNEFECLLGGLNVK